MICKKSRFVLLEEHVQILLQCLPVTVGPVSEPDEGGVDAGLGVLAILVDEAESPGGPEAQAGVGGDDASTGLLGILWNVEVESLEEYSHAETPEEGEYGCEEKVEEYQLVPGGDSPAQHYPGPVWFPLVQIAAALLLTAPAAVTDGVPLPGQPGLVPELVHLWTNLPQS